MTQQHHGQARAEVGDLRNIVDRLDLLMDATSSSGGGATDRERTGAVLMKLVDRVAGLENEVEELRTLINHLMTIATWQARVTATLVDDRAPEELDVHAVSDEPVRPQRTPGAPSGAQSTPGAPSGAQSTPGAPSGAQSTPGAPPGGQATVTGPAAVPDDAGRRATRPATAQVAAAVDDGDDGIDDVPDARLGRGQRSAPPPDFGI